MPTCETCGNTYDKTFDVVMGGETRTFDSFECAIQAVAPRCEHCGCRIIGHGLETDGVFYCCAHCASQKGVEALRDRV
jgi:Rieske Fe-S protein